MAPTSALVEALQAGDLASAVRILDAAVAGEEAKTKKKSSADDRANGDGAPSSASSSSSSLRLANVLANRALCHERLGMMRRALKVRKRSENERESRKKEKREREGWGGDKSRSMSATGADDGGGGKTLKNTTAAVFFFFHLRPAALCHPPLFRAHKTAVWASFPLHLYLKNKNAKSSGLRRRSLLGRKARRGAPAAPSPAALAGARRGGPRGAAGLARGRRRRRGRRPGVQRGSGRRPGGGGGPAGRSGGEMRRSVFSGRLRRRR